MDYHPSTHTINKERKRVESQFEFREKLRNPKGEEREDQREG